MRQVHHAKSLALAAALAVFCASAAVAQEPAKAQTAEAGQEARSVIKSLGLTPEELAKIESILDEDNETIALKRADIQVLQAQIARVMLEPSPSLDQIGALVKKGQVLEYDIRMIQFARQLEIKKLLGEKRWAALYRFARAASEAIKAGQLKELFREEKLDREELKTWSKLLDYARRFL